MIHLIIPNQGSAEMSPANFFAGAGQILPVSNSADYRRIKPKIACQVVLVSISMAKLTRAYSLCSPFTKTWREIEERISRVASKTATPFESITTLETCLSTHFLVEEADLT